MKIVTKKQMRLDELIKYIFDNGIEDKSFISCNQLSPMNDDVRVSGSGNIKINGYINKNTLFTVEVEEELTEDTILPTISELFYDVETDELITENHHCQSVNEILAEQDSTTVCLALFNKVGDSMTTVWTKDAGIPSEGTLEI